MKRHGAVGVLLACVLITIVSPLRAQTAARLVVRAENTLAITRPDETIAIPWASLLQRLPALRATAVRAVDNASGAELPVQALDGNRDGTVDSLLVLVSFWPRETRVFVIEATAPRTPAAPRVHAKYVGDRDDIAFESDRIAYRMYGQGLWKQEDTHSSGIDVWPKRTHELVLDKWYAKGHDEYHTDRGEGADFFKVGPTLGAGGTAIWKDGKLYRAENFKTQRVVADGPIRAIAEMDYERWDAAGRPFTEMKRISVDAGSNLVRAESIWRSEGSDAEFTYAIGTVKRPHLVGSLSKAQPWAWLSTWGPIDPSTTGHSDLGTAVLMDRSKLIDMKETDDHYVILSTARPGVPVAHYVGAGWTASRDFTGPEDWWRYLEEYAQRLSTPIKLTFTTETRTTSDEKPSAERRGAKSASVIGGQQLENTKVAQPEELLAGRFAGVRVMRLSDGNIAVRIRGGTSVVGSNEPLYVLDGMPIEPGPAGSLAGINPNDIVKIEVLKDIGATALYGVRGANGVVLITTRHDS